MGTRPTVLYYSPAERPVPDLITSWLGTKPFSVIHFAERGELETVARRSPPLLIVIDADGAGSSGSDLCRSLKDDAFSAIVPVVFVAGNHATETGRCSRIDCTHISGFPLFR